MKQDGAARRRGEKAKAPPDGPPPAPPDVEMQEETAAVPAGEAGGERQPQRELDAITLEGERRPGGGGGGAAEPRAPHRALWELSAPPRPPQTSKST